MRFVFATARKDLLRRLHDPLGMIIWVTIPLFVVGLLYLIFGRSGGTPQGLLLVADEDQSFISSFVSGSFTQGPLAGMLTVERVEQGAGRARMDRGEASALLVIPKGFGTAALHDQPTRLTLIVNPSQRILPRIIEGALALLSEAAFYLQQGAAEPLRAINSEIDAGRGMPPTGTITKLAALVSDTFRRLQAYINPPLIALETEVVKSEGPAFNFGAAFFPATLFMSLLFSAQGLSEDMWVERRLGTLRRAAASPQSLLGFLLGKVIAATVVIGAIVAAAFAMGSLIGVEMHGRAGGALWVLLSGAGIYLLMLLLQLFATTQRSGNVMTSLVVFPCALVGGSFFPLEMMPAGLAAIGRWTPNGWSVTVLKTILDGTAAPAALLLPLLILMLWIGLFLTLAAWRLKAVLARSG